MQAKRLAILKLNWSLVRKKKLHFHSLSRPFLGFLQASASPTRQIRKNLSHIIESPLANVPGVGPKSTMRNSADIQAFI